MEIDSTVTIYALIVLDSFIYTSCWNIDHNRLQILNTEPELQSDDGTSGFYYRRNHHLTRDANTHYRQRYPRRSNIPYYSRNHFYNTYRRPLQTRRRYGNNSRVYKPIEDPGLFYRKQHELNNTTYQPVSDKQNDEKYDFQKSRMILRQQGSVMLPRVGATAVAVPNSTTIYRSGSSRRGRNFWNNPKILETNVIENDLFESPRIEDLCVKCPAERTVIAKKGRNKVLLQTPELEDCRGRPAPKNIYFKRIYGARFGSLLTAGTSITVARVVYNNQTLQLCQYRINVIIQHCPELKVESDIVMRCPFGNVWGGHCYFRCLKHNSKLIGEQRVICNDDLSWTARPPTCESTEWCDPPTAPSNGRLDCNTPYLNHNYNIVNEDASKSAFPEGTTCKAQCDDGFLARPKIAKCIQGAWTSVPFCRKKLQRRMLRRSRRHRFAHRSKPHAAENYRNNISSSIVTLQKQV